MPDRRSNPRPTLVAAILTLATLTGAASQAWAAAPVSDDVRTALAQQGTTRVWVHLDEAADLSGADLLYTREARGRFVFDRLSSTASRSQAPLLKHLDALGVNYRSFWVTNAVVVDVDAPLLAWLSERPEVARVTGNPQLQMMRELSVDELDEPQLTDGVEWNVAEVGAPQAWARGYTGQGIVVASADTGVDWDHPAIEASYRGSQGLRADHNYNWFDGIDGRAVPYDDNGHGTFTTGQMTGEDGANQVGVAPGAQWIACKNMNAAGYGTPESYTACFQFFIAPTDVNGANPNPDLAPHVVNNSWGCPTSEGCDAETLHAIANATQAAGVMLVVSAGNSGPGCSSVEDPPATYPEVLTVGAYDSGGSLAGFSSRGPSSYDRGVKPNVSAPGVGVRSSASGGGYASGWSGTSMAAPEVAAGAAIVWSAAPEIIGDIEGTRAVLEGTAEAVRGPRCGGDRSTGANNMWGRGKLDINAAVTDALAGQ